ncbi:MAG: peptidoglycan DD-metalloendopeptidase family protein [Oscillospiraceae bacterium]
MSESSLRSVKKFITKLGAHYVHMTGYVLRKLPRPFEELLHAAKAHSRRKAAAAKKPAPKKITPAAVFNVVFPAVCLCGLLGAVKHVQSLNYVVAVEIDGEDVGIITSDDVYGEAQRIIAGKMENYETDGEYYKTARLTVRPASAKDNAIDHEILADKMEQQISDMYPAVSEEPETEEEEEISFEDFITDEDDPDVIRAVMVKADGKVLGFVSSYDRIEEALNELKSVCDGMEGVEPENVFFDKEITFEPYSINKMAVVDQQKIIDILVGDESTPQYYEVQPGDYLIQIAQNLGMTLDELLQCKATYNGSEVDLGDRISVGTVIEISEYEPFLTVEYSRERSYESEVSYSTITIDDDTLPLGQTEVQTEGSNGMETVTAMITYAVEKDENGNLSGKPVRRKITSRVTTVQPVSEVIREGTMLGGPEWGTVHGNGEYFWPVDGGYISSPFGGERNHKGLDIAAPLGTPIYAAADGTVIDVGSGWNGGYGNCVVIQNDDGNITYYAHQSETACEVGEHVDAGQLIGYVGSTGDSTGNHLHFEVRSDGYLLDPEEFVSQ